MWWLQVHPLRGVPSRLGIYISGRRTEDQQQSRVIKRELPAILRRRSSRFSSKCSAKD